MANCIKRIVEDVILKDLGNQVRRLHGGIQSFKQHLGLERESYRCHPRCRGNVMKIKKWWRGKQKRVFQEDECKAYNELYSKLGMNEGEKNIYKHTKSRKMKTRDLM